MCSIGIGSLVADAPLSSRVPPWNWSREDACGPGLARDVCAIAVAEWHRDLRLRCAPIDRHPLHARGPIRTTLPFDFQDVLPAGARRHCGPQPTSELSSVSPAT